VVHSVDEAVDACSGAAEAFVIGGSTIYEAFWPLLDRLHLTVVHASFDGDTWFRGFDLADWRVVEVTDYPETDRDAWRSTVFVLDRRRDRQTAPVLTGSSSPGSLAAPLRLGSAGVVRTG
jgi:dihydrofolate reductase